jgi:AcrR family transcriptional regulator
VASQERAVRTRRQILEAAGAVFAERGFDGATINDIISRTGVTRGAFYFHFTNKEELATAVLSAQVDRKAITSQPLKLQELVDVGLVFAHRLSFDPMLQGSIRLSMEPSRRGIDRSAPFYAWIEHNRLLLDMAREQGEVYAHVDTRETAELLVGSFSGLQALSDVLTERRDLERRVATMLAHLLPNIATPWVLARLDASAGRGARLWENAVEDGDTWTV